MDINPSVGPVRFAEIDRRARSKKQEPGGGGGLDWLPSVDRKTRHDGGGSGDRGDRMAGGRVQTSRGAPREQLPVDGRLDFDAAASRHAPEMCVLPSSSGSVDGCEIPSCSAAYPVSRFPSSLPPFFPSWDQACVILLPRSRSNVLSDSPISHSFVPYTCRST
jgi:hypothetical protein